MTDNHHAMPSLAPDFLDTASKDCDKLLAKGNNAAKWLGIFAGLFSMLQIVCGTAIMVGQSMGLEDTKTIAIAATGVFIKAIESHFALNQQLVKVRNALKALSELDHDVKSAANNPGREKVAAFEERFHTQMKKVKADLL